MSYGRGQSGGFPGEAPGKRGGGAKAGGGIFTLLIIGAVLFFMFGGLGRGANQNQNPNDQQGGGTFDDEDWRPDQGESRRNNNDGFDINGDQNADAKQNDSVENEDGWSMSDADAKKKKKQFNFSNEKKEPASDAVKKDGWEMKDADKKKGTQLPLSDKTKPKSDAVKKDGWEVKDATGKGSGN